MKFISIQCAFSFVMLCCVGVLVFLIQTESSWVSGIGWNGSGSDALNPLSAAEYSYFHSIYKNSTGLEKLPPLDQKDNRILIANVYGGRPAEHTFMMHNQLKAYVDMCEYGWEIHVVMISFDYIEFPLQHEFRRGDYFCHRRNHSITVVMKRYPATGIILSAKHRELFANQLGMGVAYDYFLSHEDDVLMTVDHLQYFKKWTMFLVDDLKMVAFIVKEIYWDKGTSIQEDVLPHFFPRNSYSLFYFGGVLFVRPEKSSIPGYMLTQDMLRQAVALPFWLQDDENILSHDFHVGEINVYFQHQWMWQHDWFQTSKTVSIWDKMKNVKNRMIGQGNGQEGSSYALKLNRLEGVIPLHEFHRAMTHHQPNKYAASSAKRQRSLRYEEHMSSIYQCLGWQYPPEGEGSTGCPDDEPSCVPYVYKGWDVNVSYRIRNSDKITNGLVCQQCLSSHFTRFSDHSAVAEILGTNYTPPVNHNSSVEINFKCGRKIDFRGHSIRRRQ
jgi:hypothetical protein